MVKIRSVKSSDANAIAVIYNHFIEHTVATFEQENVSTAEMQSRIAKIKAQQLPWLVLEDERGILGYAYATRWKERVAYRFSVETTIYLKPGVEGKGLGTTLYSTLFELLKNLNLHSAIAGIALPNEHSIKLHEKMGMRKVAHFEEVGFKLNRWIDTGYWQKTLS